MCVGKEIECNAIRLDNFAFKIGVWQSLEVRFDQAIRGWA